MGEGRNERRELQKIYKEECLNAFAMNRMASEELTIINLGG